MSQVHPQEVGRLFGCLTQRVLQRFLVIITLNAAPRVLCMYRFLATHGLYPEVQVVSTLNVANPNG